VEGKKEDSVKLQEEHERIKAETETQMVRSRVNDYIAIALALGAVFILWILQMMGLY
jgi:thiamine monophosphate synthase